MKIKNKIIRVVAPYLDDIKLGLRPIKYTLRKEFSRFIYFETGRERNLYV